MEIITLTNQKGGTGKTTTAHVLACGLVKKNYNILAIDLDPQCNFSYTSGMDPDGADVDICDLFRKPSGDLLLQAITETAAGYDYIPGSKNFVSADTEFIKTGREFILQRLLKQLPAGRYDYVVIDTPPALGILTINALAASDKVIITMNPATYSVQGLTDLLGNIDTVKEYCNADIKIDGLLFTMFRTTVKKQKETLNALREAAGDLGTKVYNATIREAAAIDNYQDKGGNLFTDFPRENVTADYTAFIEEFIHS